MSTPCLGPAVPDQSVDHFTRFDGQPGGQAPADAHGLNPRLRQEHQDWAFGEIKRWNRGAVQVWSFRHDFFAGEREMAHVESDLFTEVVSSVLHPGISVRFLYLVRGDLRVSRGFQYDFATSTLDQSAKEVAAQKRHGGAYGKEQQHNIQTVFGLVQKLRSERDWSLHWTALRYCLFDTEVNKWLV